MIISPFTPLFFSPSTDRFGAESKYIQLFSPIDNIFIEVLSEVEPEIIGNICNKVTGEIYPLEFQSFMMDNNIYVFYTVITGLSNGYYSVTLNEQESEIFKITDDEQELSETTLIRYSMHSNKLRRDCVFWNGETQFYFEFRAPGGFKEQFEIGNGNIVELYAIESTQKRFTLGNARGCPIWYAEHLNRILCCSNVYFNGTRFVRKGNSTPEVTQEIASLKSYIFKVTLQGMVDDIDIEFSGGGEGNEPGEGGGGYIYLIKVNDNVVPTDKNTFSSLRILAEINKAIQNNNESLLSKFLSKDKPDITNYLKRFLGG